MNYTDYTKGDALRTFNRACKRKPFPWRATWTWTKRTAYLSATIAFVWLMAIAIQDDNERTTQAKQEKQEQASQKIAASKSKTEQENAAIKEKTANVQRLSAAIASYEAQRGSVMRSKYQLLNDAQRRLSPQNYGDFVYNSPQNKAIDNQLVALEQQEMQLVSSMETQEYEIAQIQESQKARLEQEEWERQVANGTAPRYVTIGGKSNGGTVYHRETVETYRMEIRMEAR